MRILSRYLALRFVGLFLVILFVSTLAIIVVEMLLNFDEIWQDGAGAIGALSYLFLRIPSYYLRDLVPITAFAAAFFSLGLAAHWRELTAARAGGVSTGVLVGPILLAAVALGCATFVLNETVVIDATRGFERRLRGGDQSISFRSGTFWYHRGRTIYNIASANRAEQTLRDVAIYELSDSGRLLRSVHAESASIHQDPRWTLVNATIRRFDPTHVDAAPRTQRLALTEISLDEGSGDALLEADAQSLTLPDLQRFIWQGEAAGEDVEAEKALLHARLAEPVAVVLFTLLALPLGLRVEQTRSLARPAVYAVALVAAFYAVKNTTVTLATESLIPATAGAWAPILVFGAFGVAALIRESR